MKTGVFVLLAVVVLAGCGGSKSVQDQVVPAPARAFSWNDSVACWRGAGGDVSLDDGELDLVALRAPQAAYVTYRGHSVTVSFAQDVRGAEQLALMYGALAKTLGASTNDGVLERDGNAVLAWDLPVPSSGVRDWARGCLKP